MFGVTSCKNDDDPEPAAPTMSNVAITGDAMAFEATVTFSEAVFSSADKTGSLSKESFSLSIEGGEATITDYTVNHTAGETTAAINLTMSDYPSWEEILVVKPASATSIYSSEGKAMEATAEAECSFNLSEIIITDKGNGTGTETWTSDKVYILNGLVFINDGQTLTIEPGTVIKGMPGQGEEASALIVARGVELWQKELLMLLLFSLLKLMTLLVVFLLLTMDYGRTYCSW